MSKHSKAWWLAGSVALVLAGCGGGSGSSNDSGTGTGPDTGTGTTDPSKPVQANLAERIEPYDTAAKSAVAATKSAAAVHGAAAEQAIAKVALAAPASTLQKSTLNAALEAKPGTPMKIGVSRDVSPTATAAITSASVTACNTSGQACTSATVNPVVSASPYIRASPSTSSLA